MYSYKTSFNIVWSGFTWRQRAIIIWGILKGGETRFGDVTATTDEAPFMITTVQSKEIH